MDSEELIVLIDTLQHLHEEANKGNLPASIDIATVTKFFLVTLRDQLSLEE